MFLQQTAAGGLCALFLLLLQRIFRNLLSPRWQYGIWGVLVLRLLIPAGVWGRSTVLDVWPWLEAARAGTELTLDSAYSSPWTLSLPRGPIPLLPAEAPRSLTDWLFLLYLAGALGLLGYNQWDNGRAQKAAAQVLDQLETTLDEQENHLQLLVPTQVDDTAREMTVTAIDGWDYIGYLSIPSIGLALPVMSEWSYPGLKIAPGRYAGSVFTDDLVICGHNYARHFSPVKRLAIGTTVQFVDMDGREWDYTVSKVETLQPTQIEEMVGKADGDDWDLTLFTCTTGGSARCAVRCTRVETAS